MRRLAHLACPALALALVISAAAEEPAALAPKNAAFESLKSLAGTWTGQAAWDEGGQKGTGEVSVIFKLTAGGSAVEETQFPGTPHEMITVYHMDGDDVMLTHYCAAGNQPRMKLEPAKEPNVLSFKFVGGSNMKDSDMHMHSARITLTDANHIQGVWSSVKDGQPAGEAKMDLARKK